MDSPIRPSQSPPWASELRAKNRRVARNICSTSALPDSVGRPISSEDIESFIVELDQGKAKAEGKGTRSGPKLKPGEGQGSISMLTKMKKVDDPNSIPGPGAKANDNTNAKSNGKTNAKQTEKLYPQTHGHGYLGSGSCSAAFENEDTILTAYGMTMTNHNHNNYYENANGSPSDEPSLMEYGPGIVRKLRSKYQSLALRQYTSNTSLSRGNNFQTFLRRAASLENGLENENVDEEIEIEEPEEERRKIPNLSRSRPVNNKFNRNRQGPRDENTKTTNNLILSNRNRLRRARSVDILQSQNSYENDYIYDYDNETHKENVNNESDRANNCQLALKLEEEERILLEKFRSVVSPKEEVIIIEMSKSNGTAGGIGVSVCPGQELPPHDIVRDTARLFEPKTTWKKLGHGIIATNTTNNTNQQKRLNSNSNSTTTTTTTTTMDSNNIKKQKAYVIPQVQKSQYSKSPSPIPSTASPVPTSTSTTAKLQSPSTITPVSPAPLPLHSPTRQIGIIRPTLQKFQIQGANSTASIQNQKKPPLSPKPNFVITSSSTCNNSRQTQSPSPIPVQASPLPNTTTQTPSQNLLRKHDILIPKDELLETSSPASNNTNKLPFQIPKLKHVQAPIPNSKSSSIEPISIYQKVSDKTAPVESISLQKSPNTGSKSSSAPVIKTDVPIPEKSSTLPEINQRKSPSPEPEVNTTKKSLPITITKKLPIVSLLEKKEGEALKHGIKSSTNNKNNANSIVTPSPNSTSDSQPLSDLRSYQKRKSTEHGGSGSSAAPMVFNFTKTRSKVPDYIEDDGLYTAGTDAADGSSSLKIPQFIGANIIINGRSSLQKKPKSQKKSIQFDESGFQTFEYPSESSILLDDGEGCDDASSGAGDAVDSGKSSTGTLLNNLVNNNGGGLGSYTPSKSSLTGGNSYQLGSYAAPTRNTKFHEQISSKDLEFPGEEEQQQDYLKPSSGSTTWSSEIGAADILF